MKLITSLLLLSLMLKTTLSECSEGCLSCVASPEDSTFSCQICDSYNFYYRFPGKSDCEKFEIRHCEVPSVERLCLLCEPGFVQDEVAGKCVQVSGSDLKSNCLRYDAAFACLQCESGHFMDGSACSPVTTQVSNCQIYDSAETCSVCSDGHFLKEDAEGKKTCRLIPGKSNCWRYSMMQCDECASEFVLNRNFFLDGMLTQGELQENVRLVEKEFLLSPKEGGVCVSREDEFCLENDASTGVCLRCDSGYYLDASKKCVKNPEDSVAHCMEYSSPGNCTRCETAFYLSSKQCHGVTPVEHCVRYLRTTNACEECKPEYYVSGSQCKVRNNVIIPGCSKLNLNADSCNSCESGFVKSTDQMKCFREIKNCTTPLEQNPPTPPNAEYYCDECASDYFPNTDGTRCFPQYVENCLTYTPNTNECSECMQGFYLDSKKCHPLIVANCKTPSTTTIGNCDDCHEGYYKSDNKCHKITVQNCKVKPTVEDKCAECVDDNLFYLTSEGRCVAYDLEGCSEPESGQNTCRTCDASSGFQKVGDKCLLNPISGCSNYDFTNETCTSCHVNYYKDASGMCQLYSVRNCNGRASDKNECTACQTGFYLKDGVCIPFDLPGCNVSNLGPITENSCASTTCKTGYYKDGDHCKPYSFDPLTCKDIESTSDTCTACKNDQSFFKDIVSGICVKKSLPGCKTLKLTDFSKCTDCLGNFFMRSSDEQCQPYTMPNCKTFNANEDKCASCVDGFVLDSSKGTCIKSTIFGCVEFKTSDWSLCETCADGFNKNASSTKCEVDTALTGCVYADALGDCKDCKEGMYLKNDVCNAFTVDLTNCIMLHATEDQCEQCRPGYLWNNTDGKCEESSTPYCFEYSAGVCSQCVPGRKFSSSACANPTTKIFDSNCLKTNDSEGVCTTCKENHILVDSEYSFFTDENCEKFNITSGSFGCQLCKPYFKYDGSTSKCVADTAGPCIQKSANPTDDLGGTPQNTNCTMCQNQETQVLTGGSCVDRNNFIQNCAEYDAETDGCAKCVEGQPRNQGSSTPIGICQSAHSQNLATWPTDDDGYCFAVSADSYGVKKASGTFINCSICKPGFYVDATKDDLTANNCVSDADFTEKKITTGASNTFSPIYSEAANTEISECIRHVMVASNGSSTNILLCAQCAEGFTGTIDGTVYLGGTYLTSLDSYEIYGHGMLYSGCTDSTTTLTNIGSTGSVGSPVPLTKDTLENCETYIKLKNNLANYSDDNETDACIKCKVGYEATPYNFNVTGGTTKAAVASNNWVRFHFSCEKRNFNFQKKYKGIRPFYDNNNYYGISKTIAHDSCRNGDHFGVFTRKQDNHYFPTATPDIGNVYEVCAPKFKSVILNCQINIFKYVAKTSSYTNYDAQACFACKPGFKWPSRTDTSACNPIENCNMDPETNTWMGACETCQDGYIWEYKVGDKAIRFETCISDAGISNCHAITSAGVCKICKPGYDLVNGQCQSILQHYSDCVTPGYGLHDMEAVAGPKQYGDNSGFFLNFYADAPPIFGCGGCSNGTMVNQYSSSMGNLCYQSTLNVDSIPNCKQYVYSTSGDDTCALCKKGYVRSTDEKQCQLAKNLLPGCKGILGVCSDCEEGYTSIKIVTTGIDDQFFCISNEYLMNPSSSPIETPYFKEGFRPMDFTENVWKILPIEEGNPCAQYAQGKCIKCKDASKIPLILSSLLADGMPNVECVPYENPKKVYPQFLMSETSGLATDFKFKGVPTTSSLNGRFLNEDASKLCLEKTSVDEFCEDAGVYTCNKCIPGYHISITAGQKCMKIPLPNCIEYLHGTCIDCKNEFFLNSGECEPRTVLNCKEFSKLADQCTSCEENHFINSSGICTIGTQDHCAKLSVFGDYCVECVKGFYNDDGECKMLDDKNCKTHFETDNLCKECQEGHFLKEGVTPGDRVCVEYTAKNCSTFREDSDHCATCPEGLFLDETLNCSPPEQRNCKDYHPFEDRCLTCHQGFFLKDGTCASYTVQNCKVFSGTSDSCLQCVPGQFRRSGESEGSDCWDYSVSNCLIRNPFEDHCLSCLPGHYLREGDCVPYTLSHCVLPNPSRNECIVCQKGFVLGEGSECQLQNARNCKTFLNHISGCSVCNPGFFLDNETKQCRPYTRTKCTSFSRSSDTCLVCMQDTYLSEGKCLPYSVQFCNSFHPYEDKCLSCHGGYFKNDDAECQPYDLEHCEEMSDYSNTCVKCEKGFYLDENAQCQEHTSMCKDYDMYADKCLSCKEGFHFNEHKQCRQNTVDNCESYIPNSNECRSCSADKWKKDNYCYEYTAKNCKTFKPDQNKCEECLETKFFKNSSGFCLESTEVTNCKEYSASSDQCTTCDEGHYRVSGNECRINPTGIQHCVEYTDKETCKTCKSIFYLKDNKCHEISRTVPDCLNYIQDGKCGECATGKVLDFNNTCVTPINQTCSTYENPKVCKTCRENQYLADVEVGTGENKEIMQHCVDSGIDNCSVAQKSGESSICNKCKAGYVLTNLSKECTTPENVINGCQVYVADGECERCNDQMILSTDKKKCEADMTGVGENCLVGHASLTPQCYQCAPGYWFNQEGDCVECGGEGCDVCSSDGQNCKVCKRGFFMTTRMQCQKYPEAETNRVIEDEGTWESSSVFESEAVFTLNLLLLFGLLVMSKLA